MHLSLAGGLLKCLVITKSYGDIKTQGRYSIQCRRQTNSFTTQTHAGTAFPGTVFTLGWKLTCSLTYSKGTAAEQFSPLQTLKPSLQFPTLPPSPRDLSPQHPSLTYRGWEFWSHLPCYSASSAGRLASVPLPCSEACPLPTSVHPGIRACTTHACDGSMAFMTRQGPP